MYFWHSDRLADELVEAPITETTKVELLAEATRFDRLAHDTLVSANAFADVVVIALSSFIAWVALGLGVTLLIGLW